MKQIKSVLSNWIVRFGPKGNDIICQYIYNRATYIRYAIIYLREFT